MAAVGPHLHQIDALERTSWRSRLVADRSCGQRLANGRMRGIHAQRLAGLGVVQLQQSDRGQLVLARIEQPDRDQVARPGRRNDPSKPSSRKSLNRNTIARRRTTRLRKSSPSRSDVPGCCALSRRGRASSRRTWRGAWRHEPFRRGRCTRRSRLVAVADGEESEQGRQLRRRHAFRQCCVPNPWLPLQSTNSTTVSSLFLDEPLDERMAHGARHVPVDRADVVSRLIPCTSSNDMPMPLKTLRVSTRASPPPHGEPGSAVGESAAPGLVRSWPSPRLASARRVRQTRRVRQAKRRRTG